jgi:hypothetical protein
MFGKRTFIHVFAFSWFLIAGMALFEAVGSKKTDIVFKQYEMAATMSLGVLLGIEFFWFVGIISNHAVGPLEAAALLVGNSMLWGIAFLKTPGRRIYYMLANGGLLAAVFSVPANAGLFAVIVGISTFSAAAIKLLFLRFVKT